MIFTINSIAIKDAADAWVGVVTKSADLAYCTRVSRPAWYKEGNYTNAGIDSLVISFDPTAVGYLPDWKVGDKKDVKIVGAISALATKFLVCDLTRVSANEHRLYLMPVAGEPIVESAN